MNSFRSAILSGKGLHSGDPIVRQKKKRGAEEDDLSSVAVARTEKRTRNHRDNDRHRLEEDRHAPALKAKMHDVEVINLSGGGAMIRCRLHTATVGTGRPDFRRRVRNRMRRALDARRPDRAGVRARDSDRLRSRGARCPAARRHPSQLSRKSPCRIAKNRPSSSRAMPGRTRMIPSPTVAAPSAAIPSCGWARSILQHNNEKVRLRNISENGALIESPISYPLGAEIYCSTLVMPASISRPSTGPAATRSGLKFLRTVRPEALGKRQAPGRAAIDDAAGPSPGEFRSIRTIHGPTSWNRQSIDELRDDLEGYLKR